MNSPGVNQSDKEKVLRKTVRDGGFPLAEKFCGQDARRPTPGFGDFVLCSPSPDDGGRGEGIGAKISSRLFCTD